MKYFIYQFMTNLRDKIVGANKMRRGAVYYVKDKKSVNFHSITKHESMHCDIYIQKQYNKTKQYIFVCQVDGRQDLLLFSPEEFVYKINKEAVKNFIISHHWDDTNRDLKDKLISLLKEQTNTQSDANSGECDN